MRPLKKEDEKKFLKLKTDEHIEYTKCIAYI